MLLKPRIPQYSLLALARSVEKQYLNVAKETELMYRHGTPIYSCEHVQYSIMTKHVVSNLVFFL